MYEDLIEGALGSPALVDAAFSAKAATLSVTPGLNNIVTYLRLFLTFTIDLMRDLSSWIRSEPIVMAVIALLFTGFICSIFMRIYHSA